MPEEATITPPPNAAATPPAAGGNAPAASLPAPAAAGRSSSPEASQSFSEFVRSEHARTIAEEDAAGAGGAAEGAAQDPAAGDPAAKAGAAEAGTDPAAAAGDVLSEWGINPEGLPPEVTERLRTELGQVSEYLGEWREFQERTAAAWQQVEQREQRLQRVLSDPRLQKAVQAIAAEGAEQPPQFETEVERRLWQQSQELRQRLGEFERRSAEREEQQTREQTTRDATGYANDIAAIHKRLDPEFPELAKDAKLRAQWHDKVAKLAAAYAEGNEPVDLEAIFRDAAYILHYPNAQKNGATNALSAARQAGRTAAVPRQASRGAPVEPGPLPGESLGAFARRTAGETAAA